MTIILGIRSLACFALLTVLANSSLGVEPAVKGELPNLVVGDAYKVTVKGQTTEDAIGWVLVKETDDWVVLGSYLSQGRYECNEWYGIACDLLSMLKPLGRRIDPEQVPLLGQLLTSRSVAYQKVFYWVPRAEIKSIERYEGNVDPIFTAFKTDTPTLAGECTVYCGSGKDAKQYGGDAIAIAEGEVTLNTAGKQTKLALAEVTLIFQTTPFDYAKFKAELEQKTTK